MSCLLVSHRHLTSITLLHSYLGTGMRVGNRKHFRHYRASPVQWHSRSCWLEQYHGTATSGRDCLDPLISNKCWFMCVSELATVSRDCYCGARIRDGRSTPGHSGYWQVAQSCSFFTVANTHMNSECAKRRSVCIALLLLIRDLCLKPGAEVLTGDFSKDVEGETPSGDFGERRISPLEAAFQTCQHSLAFFWRHPTVGVPAVNSTASSGLIGAASRFSRVAVLVGYPPAWFHQCRPIRCRVESQ